MNVRKLLEELGFNGNQGEIDDSIQWALVELFLLRKENKNKRLNNEKLKEIRDLRKEAAWMWWYATHATGHSPSHEWRPDRSPTSDDRCGFCNQRNPYIEK